MPDKDLQSIQAARDLVEAAHRAQAVVATFDQARIDAICEVMAQAAQRESMRLAQLAHDETGYGNAADKHVKNLFSAVNVHNYFKGLKTVGVVRDNGSVVEIAAPRGVVAAIIPSTNPTSTAIFKILISIKSRNAVVLSPHPSATRCVVEVAHVMRAAGVQAGLPAEAIGCIELTTLEGTETLMKHKHTAVILATGGLGLVRAAYSSGKPAFGVGPGNVPALIERTADAAKAVRDILAGTCFDFGTICASEQAMVVDAPLDAEVRAQLAAQGACFLNATQADALAKLVVGPNRHLNPKIVGKPATLLAEWAGISVPSNTRCLIAEGGGVGRDYPLSIEKLSPILAYYVVDGLAAGSKLCDEILHFGGMGHTASIHTRNREAALQYGALMPAARVVVNSPSTHGAIGFSTDLAPSMTLGCGSWGGNVTSDNISPLHLMDIKRVAFETRPVTSGATNAPLTAATAAQVDGSVIAALVDKLFAARQFAPAAPAPPANAKPNPHPGTGAAPVVVPPAPAPAPAKATQKEAAEKPKPKAVDFVCEEDVKRALARNEKIFVNAKTIITPAARDVGNEREIFVKTVG
ncbi:MAG: aldehyde dehydrogenase family protein [Acidobacteria bacterium]|nr:aldehyde dehydrogenase family protein [Acidobacteriota bacterium]MBI3424493.1 aldehyde dehydrogenase family protein [Acidobacteriota bacterium]